MPISTHWDRLSHHINLAHLGGTAVEKLKGKRVQGYKCFTNGSGESLNSGGGGRQAHGGSQRVHEPAHTHLAEELTHSSSKVLRGVLPNVK